MKNISYVNMGQSPNSEDCNDVGNGVPFLQGNAEFGRKTPSPKQFCEVAKKNAKPGDFLFSVRAPVGAVNIANQLYGIGRGLCAIRPSSDVINEYLWWVLQISKVQFDAISTGSTFEAVSAEQVNNFSLALPSRTEQKIIAAFLDYETARIDQLIAKQQQLIELLKEKRQAVISHAVTKGLNPNAPMKDSGVEWLGQVPEHWVVSALNHYVDTINGYGFSS
ncbi:restriction endonuclease subunit S, partial [Vibrio parahaemolyticus]|nr:restriction endonuclease subunit S [Vibrio parahaemolyticus]